MGALGGFGLRGGGTNGASLARDKASQIDLQPNKDVAGSCNVADL